MLVAVGAVSLTGSRVLLALMSVVFCVEFGLVTSQSFGGTFARRSYPAVVAPESSPFRARLEQVVRTTCPAAANGRISVVGADLPFLNGNTLTMIAADAYDLQGRHCYYTPLGYAATDPLVAWRRVLTFKPPFYVSLDYARTSNALPSTLASQITPGDPFNVVNREVYHRVMRSRHFRVLEGSRREGLIIFKGSW